MEGLDAEEGVKLAKFLAKKRGGTIGMYFLGGSEDAEDMFPQEKGCGVGIVVRGGEDPDIFCEVVDYYEKVFHSGVLTSWRG